MRKLQLMDVLAFGRVLETTGCRDDIRELMEASAAVKDTHDMQVNGYNMLFGVFTKLCAHGQDYVCEFLAGPFECTADEALHMDLDVLVENFKQLAKENDLVAFFTKVTGASPQER